MPSVATPPTSSPLCRTFAPSRKTTVPVGVPSAADTVAVRVTGSPRTGDAGAKLSAVFVPVLMTGGGASSTRLW